MALLLAMGTSALAVDPHKPIREYVRDSWATAEGLPNNSVLAITQTSDGYLWLGTGEGLVRFNGAEFKAFATSDVSKPQGNTIMALLEDKRDGGLLVGTYGAGVLRYRAGGFTSYAVEAGAPENNINALAQDGHGVIWIATAKGLATLQNGKFDAYTKNKDLRDEVVALAASSDGSIWAATRSGIFRINQETSVKIQFPKNVNLPSALYFDRSGTLWIGTTADGLYSFSNGKLTHYKTGHIPETRINTVYEDNEGTIWVGLLKGGACRLRLSKFDCYSEADGLTDHVVSAVYEDREGSLWIGTVRGGLNRLKNRKFLTWNRDRGLPDDYAQSLYRSKDGSIWIGTDNGIARLKDGKITPYRIGNTDPENEATALAEDSRGTLWIGTLGGLKEFRDGRVIKTYGTRQGLPNDRISALYADHHGYLWIGNGSSQGAYLARWKNGRFTFFTEKDGLADRRIHSITEDPQGNLWFATSRGVMELTNNGVFATYPMDGGKPGVIALCLYADANHDLWIGTVNSGLSRLRAGHISTFKMKDGFFDDTVFSVVEDRIGNLWITSNRGLARIRKQDLNDFADHKRNDIPHFAYGTKDGLLDSEFNGTLQSMGIKTGDGKLFFASPRGAVEVDPEHFQPDAPPPPIVIERAVADGRLITHEAQLPVGTGSLEFQFAALTYLGQQNVRYKYMLEGHENKWSPLYSLRVVPFNNIAPGTYTFRVMGSNNDGVWKEGPPLRFVLEPRFSQTPWFKILCALALVLFGVGLNLLRIFALKATERRLLALVEDRTRELRDSKDTAEAATRAKGEFLANMSHEIRTPLNGVLGMLEVASQTGLTPEQAEILGIAGYSAKHLLGVLNDILDFSKIEAGKLELASEEFRPAQIIEEVEQMFSLRARDKKVGISCRIASEIPEWVVGDPARLKQVLVNLVGNALKFTEEGKVTISVDLQDRSENEVALKICVADTGIGIPPEHQQTIFKAFHQADTSSTRRFGGTGLGLAISSHLISLMGGQIWLESKPGAGSRFYFTVLFKIAAGPRIPEDSLAGVAPHYSPLPPLRILLAEDNIINQKLAVRLLENHGHEVVVAHNGKEVLDCLERSSFDLVLMDVQMPEMDGFRATSIIRRQEQNSSRHLPVIAMTAHAMKGDRERCLEAGMDGYVAKPINSAVLFQTIRTVLLDLNSSSATINQVGH